MEQVMKKLALLVFAVATVLWPGRTFAQAAEAAALQLEAKIPLGVVSGRIDHMAVDLDRQHLFIAELGNNSVGVVDLKDRKLLRRITGLKEPQGVAYVRSSDTLYVTNAGDGSVRLFGAGDYAESGRIDLADDADNVRVDVGSNRIFVGYGNGGLAVIDANSRSKVAEIPLKAHPESFQLDASRGLIFVNVPKAQEIAVIDRAAGKQIAGWSLSNGSSFPMVLDADAQRVLVVSRSPAALGVYSMQDGAVVARVETCGDADDLFVDAKRHRIYVSCGEGFLDVFDAQGNAYRRLARIRTTAGARTSLFVPEMDRLLLAVRAAAGEPASIWVFRPNP
jgi:DNA-binding beta-propeller fold protein YncE